MPNWLMDGLTDVAILLTVFVVSWGIYSLVTLWRRTPSTPARATVHPIRLTTVRCLYAHDVDPNEADYTPENGWLCRVCRDNESASSEWSRSTGDVA